MVTSSILALVGGAGCLYYVRQARALLKEKVPSQLPIDFYGVFLRISLRLRAIGDDSYKYMVPYAQALKNAGLLKESKFWFETAKQIDPLYHVPFWELHEIAIADGDIDTAKKLLTAQIEVAYMSEATRKEAEKRLQELENKEIPKLNLQPSTGFAAFLENNLRPRSLAAISAAALNVGVIGTLIGLGLFLIFGSIGTINEV